MTAKKATRTSLKPSKTGGTTGKTVIVRPSLLAAEGKTGIVAKGILEDIKPNKFNETKNDYFIRDADDTLYIVNSTTGLAEQLEQDGVKGMNLEVVYNGKIKTKNGKGYHDFEVFQVNG